MTTEIAGYRQHATGTATTTTLNLDLDEIRNGHKVYVERLAVESSKANADCEIVIVSGGQEFPVQEKEDVSAAFAHGLRGGFWLYAAEHLRFKWSGITTADICQGWALGVDKWEAESE